MEGDIGMLWQAGISFIGVIAVLAGVYCLISQKDEGFLCGCYLVCVVIVDAAELEMKSPCPYGN